MKTPPAKRALLIASPFGELRGTLNDARSMEQVLTHRGFEISQCYGEAATRQRILEAWEELISQTAAADAVVIYYSGHGGLARPPKDDGATGELREHQFLVPIDFGETTESDFRGILDVEISHMLRQTTQKTQNTTVIIDCCHSGRMFRVSGEEDHQVRIRRLPEILYHDIIQHLATLDKGQYSALDGTKIFPLGNPHAVRIAAAATSESACEHITSRGEWGGALTEALTKAMMETDTIEMSWRTVLLRIRHLVNTRHNWQHPQVEGPDTRIQFSLQHIKSGALCLKIADNRATLHAGSVLGVKKGNIYTIVPFEAEEVEGEDQILTATITAVSAFTAKATLSYIPTWKSIRHEGAFAFLKYETVERLPVRLLLGCPETLREGVEQSKYIRCCTENEHNTPVVEFRSEAESIILYDRQGIRISSQDVGHFETATLHAFWDIIATAERMARVQRVLNLRCDHKQLHLKHRLDLEIGTVENGEPGTQFNIGNGSDNHVTEADSIYFSLSNSGSRTVYLSLFNINVAGHIALLTNDWPDGIELLEGDTRILGTDDFDELVGTEVCWPDDISREQSVTEEFLFIVTSSPVDLRYLVESTDHDITIDRDAKPISKSQAIHYDIIHVPFTLHPLSNSQDTCQLAEDEEEREDLPHPADDGKENNAVAAIDIPEPETTKEWEDLPQYPPTTASKGILGSIIRASKKIPSCIWVVNEHDEEITVVVSQFRPNRMLSGVDLNASATGGGISFNTTTFNGPATKKTLRPQGHRDGGSVAVFPLWSRSQGFGVTTIFKGAEKTLFIENDRVPVGATAYFMNKPDLRMEEYCSA
ncbi:hypothetical protein BO78DRAFT_373860 [Aspergillus sclerotiicarbonarius CBS 121057]|uniref:Peptidase C14 caspase domain-containing protein n=1 Tax=Aspergillus sclerotiicarbonarius (strain CBS 121057 / IBT 28362) TaxID=1448318 RepID=A0A319ESU9_ASPSB|nr:hypothetical protein BO78DRAFT_373860 [Aspergillus sclerotiicarbonarius CBS 121057]